MSLTYEERKDIAAAITGWFDWIDVLLRQVCGFSSVDWNCRCFNPDCMPTQQLATIDRQLAISRGTRMVHWCDLPPAVRRELTGSFADPSREVARR